MSPRRDLHHAPRITVALLAVAFSSCVFSPKEAPPKNEPPPGPAKTADELIQKLRDAYQRRDYDEFQNLFPKPEDAVDYRFILNMPVEGVDSWPLTDELRIHKRMFHPENPDPGEPPVPEQYWLEDISISLSQSRPFSERPDLYKTPSNPSGLDPVRWRAVEAEYHAVILFNTMTINDYSVDGRANFVVIEDLAKTVGQERKFLIYRWEDLGDFTKPVVHAKVAALHT